MKHFGFAIAILAMPAAAQVQIARFDFQNQLSSVQPAFAFVSDVWLSKAHQFSGPGADRSLSLPTSWNSGGNLSFSVFPGYGQTIDFSHLQWFVQPNAAGVADCVSGVVITANGLQIASLASIPQNQVIDIDLTTIPALQNQTQGVMFDFAFVGNPTGTSSHEIGFLQVTGKPCDLEIFSVTPTTLPTATTDYFQILGAGFRNAAGQSNVLQVRFGSIVLQPYSGLYGVGTYEVFSQWKVRVRPPQCLPAGTYTVEISTACDTKSIQVNLTDPATPTIAGEGTFPAGQSQCVTIHGGPPGPKVVIMFVTPYNTPSTVPGLLDLQIGGGFAEIDTRWAIGDCGTFCFPILVSKGDSWHYHQGVIWTADNLDFSTPLPTTGVLATYLY